MFDRKGASTAFRHPQGALAATLLAAIVLALLPARAVAPLRHVIDRALEPGRIVAGRITSAGAALAMRLEQACETSDKVARLSAQARQLAERNRELEMALALAAKGTASDELGVAAAAPLINVQCIRAAVLGKRAYAMLAADEIIDLGQRAGAVRDGLALVDSTLTIDGGQDQQLAREDIALEGRRVFGKVIEVTPHTAVVRRADQAGYRDVVQLARVVDGVPRFGARGILEGAGDGGCRVRMVSASENVLAGDLVFTAQHEGLTPQPLLYGVVSAATRASGSGQWEIRVELAAGSREPDHLLILRGTVNPARLAAAAQE